MRDTLDYFKIYGAYCVENILCRVFNRRCRHMLKGLLFMVDKGWDTYFKVEVLFSIFWYFFFSIIRPGRLIEDSL